MKDLKNKAAKKLGKSGKVEVKDGDFYFFVDKEALLSFASWLKEQGFIYFSFLTAIDWKDKIELVYHLVELDFNTKAFVKTLVERRKPEIDSVVSIWRGADWPEREVYDLFGVSFKGHPNLKRLLLPDDWEGHPLLKDYRDKRVVKRPDYF